MGMALARCIPSVTCAASFNAAGVDTYNNLFNLNQQKDVFVFFQWGPLFTGLTIDNSFVSI